MTDAGIDPVAATTPETAEQREAPERGRGEAARSELRRRRGSAPRRIVVGVLVALTAVLVPLTVTVTWAHRTVLNTDAYVSTVQPVASDPAVIAAVSRQITDQIYAELDPQQRIATALPPKATFLAGPIANGAKDYVQQGVNRVLSSQQFQTLWTSANRFSHRQLVTALRGDRRALTTTNGTVVLNLVPVLNAALQNVQGFASSIVGRQVTLPTVSGNDIPSEDCAKIGAALDRALSPTCGQIPLFQAKQLTTARRLVRAFDRGTLALLILTPLVAIAALAVSRRRRRTLLQLTIGAMLGLVVFRRALFWLQSDLVSKGRPENRGARSAITDHLFRGFFNDTEWFLIGGAVIVAVALVTGPYGWAVSLRGHARRAWHGGAEIARTAAAGPTDQNRDSTSVAWVRVHFDLLRAAGVIVAVLLMLFISVNVWGFLAIAVLLVVYEVGLHRLRPRSVTLPPGDASFIHHG